MRDKAVFDGSYQARLGRPSPAWHGDQRRLQVGTAASVTARAAEPSSTGPPTGRPATTPTATGVPDGAMLLASEVVIEYVALYRASAGTAAQYMNELRADVRRCSGWIGPGRDRGDHAWSIMESSSAGDESVLLRLRRTDQHYHATPGQCCTDFYVAVVRAGDVLVAVTSLGWEGSGGDPRFAKQTAVTALSYAVALG